MNPQISAIPCPNLSVSLERQQEIINTINRKLAAHPRQGFCFIGNPGTGKTFLLKAIRESVLRAVDHSKIQAMVPQVTTLSEWHEGNRLRAQGEMVRNHLSIKSISDIADGNQHIGRTGRGTPTTLHIFMDEFDNQSTVSEFTSSNLQTFVNRVYENAPRSCTGNTQDFVQLCIAMNKSWAEFEATYGVHVARRIAEMCVRIDFDQKERKVTQ